jgi:hypothetical protein
VWGATGVCAAVWLGAACGDRTGLPFLPPPAGRPDATVGDASRGTDASVGSEASDVAVDTSEPDAPFLPFCQPRDAGEAGLCDGLACRVPRCEGGVDTIVEGYVYAPDGQLPLFNVEVYVPNAPLDPIPHGVQCWTCGNGVSGQPITGAYSDSEGHFTLHGVPAGRDVPLVVQLGKWRRATTIPSVAPCATTSLTDPDLTRLPRNQKEGSMPHVALTTGGCDQMGCMLTKLGIDLDEFGIQADGDSKAIHVYVGEGGSGPARATAAIDLWGDRTNLFEYDEAIFSCECSEALDSKGGVALGGAPFQVVTDYLNAGGRIFTTDFQYTWYKYSPDPKIGEKTAGSPIAGIGHIAGGAPIPTGQLPMVLSKTVPQAVALSRWLKYVFSGNALPSGATFPLDEPSQHDEIAPDTIFCNVQSLDPTETRLWASSAEARGAGRNCHGSSPGPRIFTVDTPVENERSMRCGRGVHIDAHVDQSDGQTVGRDYPAAGCSKTLKADEASFAFIFFDLSSCSETCD